MKQSLKPLLFLTPLFLSFFSSMSFACTHGGPDIDIKNKLRSGIPSRACYSTIKYNGSQAAEIFNSDRYCLDNPSESILSTSLPKQKVIKKMFEDYVQTYKGLSFEDQVGFADIFLQRASRMFVSTWKEEDNKIIIYFDVIDKDGKVTKESLDLFEQDLFVDDFQEAFQRHTEKYKRLQQHSLKVLRKMYEVLYVKACEV
ncbi:MAG: hypothetical protein HRT53_16605 [Colwellia sp.]|nr:hypothetical protein [Colwellia sp.]